MPTSDPAPLPRLGEVFFDVRSASRSLRISWYADTGVAVLSIWQGGTCTGSFRLPMSDLPRMVETLRRGPDGRPAPAGEHPARAADAYAPRYGERERPHSAVPASHHQYPPGPGSLRYLHGPADTAYPAIPDTAYPASPDAAYPDSHAPVRYPDSPTPARSAAGHAAGYPAVPDLPGYHDEAIPPRYPGQPGPADYPAGSGSRDFPANTAGGRYPNGAEQGPPRGGPRHYPGEPPGPEYQRAAPAPPPGHGRAATADERTEPGWDSESFVPLSNGAEPLPESFRYGGPPRNH
jgi:hypothetical protein